MSMSEAHRALLQVFVCRHVILDADLAALFQQQIFQVHNTQTSLEPFISTINDNLRMLSMEIRKIVWEEDGQLYWGLVNTKGEEHVKLATNYTIAELALFRRIMEHIVAEVSHGAGVIAGTDATNLGRSLDPPITPSRADSIIERLVADHWLAHVTLTTSGAATAPAPATHQNQSTGSSRGDRGYTLGIRAMIELRPYLDGLYAGANSTDGEGTGALPECILCSEAVLRGRLCPNPRGTCPARMHLHCGRRWFEGKRDPRCPHCSTPWPWPV